jgi:hypothetical protein
MLKITSFTLFLIIGAFSVGAQITPTAGMFQSSMAPFQATALPYNYLDKFEPRQEQSPIQRNLHPNLKANLSWYANASLRVETYPESANASKNTTLSNALTIDRILRYDKMSYKIGGGIMQQDLQIVQLNSPFLHVSAERSIEEHWRLLIGANYRFTQSRLNPIQLNYQHPYDRKISKSGDDLLIAIRDYNSHFQSFGVSTAAVHTKRGYIGLGINRFFTNEQFNTFKKKNFTEFNLLCQALVWKRYKPNFTLNKETGRKEENPNRGFLSNVNVSLSMRYLRTDHNSLYNYKENYPLYAQLSCRTTITENLWMGMGWNTANRVQIQVGLMKLPIFTQEVENEWYLWAAYDLPTQNTPYHGVEINLGYHF